MLVTARSISQNPNPARRTGRKAVTASMIKELSYLADGIIYTSFWTSDDKTDFCVFLRDQYSPEWVVSECDNYIMGGGVFRKLLKES